MPGLVRRSLEVPEEVRKLPDGSYIDLVENGAVSRATLQPGWRWSEHMKPIVETDSCQFWHIGYQISGQLHVVMDDGREIDVIPGDYVVIPPGHDAWVIGGEPAVMIDWKGLPNTQSGGSCDNHCDRRVQR